MVKFPTGKGTPHVQQSHGPDKSINKFYCTQYSTTYTKGYEKFQPRPGRHTGTGYLSNFRPQIYYSAHLDEIDNPVMGAIMSRNYQSMTSKHMVPYAQPTGKEDLPMLAHQKGTGFTRDKKNTIPTSREVKSVFIDTQLNAYPTDITPKKKCYLQAIQPKDPIEQENGAYGPQFMSTEAQTKFVEKPLNGPQVNFATATLGPNEVAGSVHNKNIEPLTFHPDEAHKHDHPRWHTYRPTGVAQYTTNYQPYSTPHGDEKMPTLAVRSERGTGFTNATKAMPVFVNRVMGDAYDKASSMPPQRVEKLKKNDPAEYLNAMNPDNGSSIYQKTFLGEQRPAASEADRLKRTDVGTKEPSGYAENNDTWAYSPDDRKRFISSYMHKFQDGSPVGRQREGFIQGGVHHQLPDGFTKSTSVHSYGPQADNTATLRRLHPYVARSVQAQDTFFDDHTYDSKKTNPLVRSMTIAC